MAADQPSPEQRPESESLRERRDHLDAVLRALVVSAAVHLLAFGAWKVDQRLHLLDRLRAPAWLAQARARVFPMAVVAPKPDPTEPTLVFVEVNPEAAIKEHVKDAKYYSDKSSRAANVEADRDTGTPRITGTQQRIIKTETVLLPKPGAPSTPSPPSVAVAAKSPDLPQPVLTPPPGSGITMAAKPASKPSEAENLKPAAPSRPRTLAEAQAKRAAMNILGESMQQEGGVKQRGRVASLDSNETSFGAYDGAVISAISSCFNRLCNEQPLTPASGRVVLEFHLNYDGSITQMTVLDTTVNEILTAIAQRAVLDPSMYTAWPDEMRRQVGRNYRECRITFYYY